MLSFLTKQRVAVNQFKWLESTPASFFATRKMELRKPFEMRSPSPNKSNRSQRGLFHGVGHSQGHRISFSHKKAIHTFKPNIHRKRIYSETLDKKIRMWVSSKALKTILKMGGLDEYLLNTNPKKIDSKFGMYLKQAILHKQENPTKPPLYIPNQKKVSIKKPKYQKSSFGGRPAIYQPPQFQVRPEFVKAHRLPTELRMREREQLFKHLKDENAGTFSQQTVEIEEKKQELLTEDGQLYDPQIHEDVKITREKFDFSKVSAKVMAELEFFKPEILQMLPFRHAAIRQELLKYKNKREKLLTLFSAIEESQNFIERALEEDYVGIFQRYPDLAQIFIEIAQRDENLFIKLGKGMQKTQPILGPEGVQAEQKLIEADTDGTGTELKTTLDYDPKKLLLKIKKKDRLKEVKKRYDHK